MKELSIVKKMYFLLGCITFSIISVMAYSVLSSDISYEPQDNKWNVNNVESALNDLYKNTIYYKRLDQTTDFSAFDLKSGKTAYTNDGALITGVINDECVTGTMTTNNGCAGATGCVLFSGFNPSKLFLYIYSNDILNYFDTEISSTNYTKLEKSQNISYNTFSSYYKYENGNFMLYNWGSSYSSKKISYIACK